MRQIFDKRGGSHLAWYNKIFFIVACAGCLCLAAPPVTAADATAPANSESRQFDFWLGDWSIATPSGNEASSRVYLALGQYLVVESWDDGKGHKGENLFAYSSDDQSWHGMFADNQGRVHVFTGKVSPGLAEFYGPSRSSNGESVLNRIRVTRLAADRIEQSWEKSSDNGASWTAVFKGVYTRKETP